MTVNEFSKPYLDLKQQCENVESLTDEDIIRLYGEAHNLYTLYEFFQLVVKRNGNSLYGGTASIFFSFHDIDIAEDITVTGKHYIIVTDKAINNFFVNWSEAELQILQEFYPNLKSIRKFTEYKPDTPNDLCIYGDTDSRYINLGKIYELMGMELPESDEELVEFAKFLIKRLLNDVIKNAVNAECDFRNSRKGYFRMAHEVTSRRCVFRAKKQYVMDLRYKDGKIFHGDKIKLVGVELKKGTMSPFAKNLLNKLLINYLVNKYSEQKLLKDVLAIMQHIKNMKSKKILYKASSVSNLKSIKKVNGAWSGDGNHIQMQIAVSWSKFIDANNLQSEYKKPFEGQKMYYYYTHENKNFKVIGVPDDVDLDKVKNLPEPDYYRMSRELIVKPLLRYIYPGDKVTDTDMDYFLNGVRRFD